MAVYLGIVTGSIARTLLPYLVKLKKNPRTKWNNKFLISAVAGIIISLFSAAVLSAQVSEGGFLLGFSLAYTFHSLSREVEKAF